MAYAETAEPVKARRALEQAIQLDPKFDGIANARRVLDGLAP
jgi:Flp pilus assembly protein TadD